ncbi:AIPR family protein [Vibrio fluvialis]|uniref:AIPR family protein n=1 Tax=Vibrio fluvialis TaxID=676 RepID=UPI001F28A30A|nr:AIPR family protein [Vibrio fluvialis]MCE7580974.1 AIPR family protein [Vibrio fluvialis]
MPYTAFTDSQFMNALKNRADLAVFAENKVSIYALELFFGLDDVLNTLSSAITGGADDAKTDVLYVNREQGSIVLIQAYEAQTFKKSAKGNKGADLSYAISVLLETNEGDIPEGIRPHVMDARAALESGEINMIHVWYLHNLPESQQIKQQMAPILAPAKKLLQSYQKHDFTIDLSIKEIGLETLDVFYKSSKQAIIIEETIPLAGSKSGFRVTHDDWDTFVTTVSGKWLADLYRKYDDTQLFSANVRGFMGANNKDNDKVINSGIQASAKSTPIDFFVFNNGITALVHDFTLDSSDPSVIDSIKGISIVNGAQTTGSLGSLDTGIDLSEIEVGVRFIKCENKEKIESITRYNNSQNKVLQSDFRANDSIQKRLREEFKQLSSAEYDGGLRGVANIDRKLKVDAHSAAQALMAWHGNPSDSYHKKMAIWENDDLYSIAFNPTITAGHVLFVYSLLEAANLLKDELRLKDKRNQTQQAEKEFLAFLNERGSAFLIIHAMKKIIEILLETNVKAPYGIAFNRNVQRHTCINLWKELITKLYHNIKTLKPGLKNRLSNSTEISNVSDQFATSFGTIFLALKGQVSSNPYKFIVDKVHNKL